QTNLVGSEAVVQQKNSECSLHMSSLPGFSQCQATRSLHLRSSRPALRFSIWKFLTQRATLGTKCCWRWISTQCYKYQQVHSTSCVSSLPHCQKHHFLVSIRAQYRILGMVGFVIGKKVYLDDIGLLRRRLKTKGN